MKKIILSFLIIACALLFAGLAYLNETILPQRIKSAVIEGFEAATGKKLEMSSAKLDIFKGLVMKDVAVLDNDLWVVTAQEANARFLIIPLFKKQIIITSLKLESPKIFAQRYKNNTINIAEIFFKNPILLKGEYNLTVSRIILSKAFISFKDSTFDAPFLKDFNGVYLDIRLSLPDKIIFNTEFGVPSDIPITVKASGAYESIKKEWNINIKAKDLYLKDFSPYFNGMDFPLPEGRLDADMGIRIDNDRIRAKIDMTSLGLEFINGRIKASINCALTANAEYDLNKKKLLYSGDIDIKNLALSGLEYVERIDDIRGKAIFTESRFLSKNLTCTLSGLPVTAIADLTDLKTGFLNIDIKSIANLSVLKEILKNKFKINIPAQLSGMGSLNLRLEYKLPIKDMPMISGYVGVSSAKLLLDYNKMPLDDVSGRLKFTSNQLSWEDLKFRYMNVDYNSQGTLTNFEKPGIDLSLNSDELSVKALIAINDNFLTLSRFEGRTGTTEFSVYGDLDITDPANTTAELNGTVKFDLGNETEPLNIFKDTLKDAKPLGRLTARFGLKGNIGNINACAADVEVSASRILLYGFRLENFAMSYVQRAGVMNISKIKASLYGGSLEGSGRAELLSKERDYQIKAEIKGLKIEDLKLDTEFKDYDISGSIHSKLGFMGQLGDPSKFSAWGKVNISKGKLWQLNLFRGIGTLIFKKDFNSVIFEEGDCDFSIKDKVISVGDINLRSDLLDISGVARIGADNSIAASLKAEFTDEGIDAGKMANVSAAIERYSIIEVSGTLKDPKIKIRPDLSSVMSDIADGLFQR